LFTARCSTNFTICNTIETAERRIFYRFKTLNTESLHNRSTSITIFLRNLYVEFRLLFSRRTTFNTNVTNTDWFFPSILQNNQPTTCICFLTLLVEQRGQLAVRANRIETFSHLGQANCLQTGVIRNTRSPLANNIDNCDNLFCSVEVSTRFVPEGTANDRCEVTNSFKSLQDIQRDQ